MQIHLSAHSPGNEPLVVVVPGALVPGDASALAEPRLERIRQRPAVLTVDVTGCPDLGGPGAAALLRAGRIAGRDSVPLLIRPSAEVRPAIRRNGLRRWRLPEEAPELSTTSQKARSR